MVTLSPLAYFLQTVPPTPALPEKVNDKTSKNYDEEKFNNSNKNIDGSPNQELTEQEEIDCRPLEDISAPNIKTAIKEALTSSTFILVTLGFSVCGFHVTFLATHFPAYLVRV